MKILFVVDELPYPPRNGVTIPIFGYLSRLSAFHKVSLLYCHNSATQIDSISIQQNEMFVENLWVIERKKNSKISVLINELFGISDNFLGWQHNTSALSLMMRDKQFDVVWGSPISVSGILADLKKVVYPNAVYIAAISDCYTAVLRNMARQLVAFGLNPRLIAYRFFQYIRSLWFGRIESKILSIFDLILVQTEADDKFLRSISAGSLGSKVMVVPNGVNQDLFELSVEHDCTDVLFVGDLSGEYKSVFTWIIDNVWPIIRKKHNSARFVIIGKNAPEKMQHQFAFDNRILYMEYVPELKDMYRNRAVILAPVFKNYGLINKVIEAMAAGVPVIGDSGSFNGIPEFRNGHQGVIAQTAEDLAHETLRLLAAPEIRHSISDSARLLVSIHFSWDNSINKIKERILSISKMNGLELQQ